MRIFLADDHPLLRTGLRLSLNQHDDIEVSGEASDGFLTVEKIQADPPDLALIDIDMPGISGIGVIKILRENFHRMKLLVLSSYNDDKYIRDAMRAGADGYVLKSVSTDELVRIIRSFCQGTSLISPYLVNLTLIAEEDSNHPVIVELTEREKEILKCIAEGKSNKEISQTLFVSVETVKSHIKNLYKKLHVKNRVEASIKGREYFS